MSCEDLAQDGTHESVRLGDEYTFVLKAVILHELRQLSELRLRLCCDA